MTGWGERIFAALLHLYPREFRERYRADLIAFYRQDRGHEKYGTGVLRPIRFWTVTLRDLARSGVSTRRTPGVMTHTPRARLSIRLGQDLRFAWRGLWASPGVTLAALAVLMLGIGAGTTVFSLVDAVALRGVPFPDSERLVSISERESPSGRLIAAAPQNYYDWRARQDAFESLGAGTFRPELLIIDEPPIRLRPYAVTASLWRVLGVAPAMGRLFREDEERPDATPVAVISDRLWRQRFGASPVVVGRTLTTADRAYRIIGVMAPDFRYPVSAIAALQVDVWLPLIPTSAATNRSTPAFNYNMSVVARLKPGVTVDDALRRMTRVRDGLAQQYPKWFERGGVTYGVMVRRLKDAVVNASVRSWMMLLLGGVSVVVLMACLNSANLLVARAVVRAPELAVRSALGASRWDVARSMLIESLLLSIIGAAGGVLLAEWGVGLLRNALPASVPRLASAAVDLRVLLATAATAIITGVVFGTLPALQTRRLDVVAVLSQGGRTTAGASSGRRFRTGLVVAEVALAVVSLAGAGLFLASFYRVTSVPLGFNPRHVVFLDESSELMSSEAIAPATTDAKQRTAAEGQARVAAAIDRVRALPGVVAVAPMQGGRPLSGSYVTARVTRVDRPDQTFVGPDEAFVRSVGRGYLDVLDAHVTAGRWIAESDVLGALPVVVLTEDAARRYYGPENPLGQRLRLDDYERTVVGVVPSMRWAGPESTVNPEVFVPYAQTSHEGAVIVVRTATEPRPLIPSMQAAIHAAIPSVVFRGPGDATLLEDTYSSLIAQRRFNMVVLSIFGVAAIAIAAVGLYGLMAFLVAQRRREIGVRVALGAARSGILRMVLASAAKLLAIGLAPGLVAALLLERAIRSFLFNATPHDPVLYAAVSLVLTIAGLVAALGPARRATRVDPLEALRRD